MSLAGRGLHGGAAGGGLAGAVRFVADAGSAASRTGGVLAAVSRTGVGGRECQGADRHGRQQDQAADHHHCSFLNLDHLIL